MAFISTANAVNGLLTTWLNRKFVSDLEWALQYQKFATAAIIPAGAGKIGRFNVFVPPTGSTSYSLASTTALTEVFTTEHEITSMTASSTDITVTEYGEFHKTSALAMYAAIPGTREKLRKRLSDGAYVTVDTLCLTACNTAATNYIYATAAQKGGTLTFNAGSVTALSAAALMYAKGLLFSKKAPAFTGIPGHPDGHYAAIIGPTQETDIVTENTTGRTTWGQMVTNVPGVSGQEKTLRGMVGPIYGVAVYVTQNFNTGTYTASSTGDISLVLADGAFGACAFKDMSPEIIINDVNSPYKNTDSIAWHLSFGVGAIDTVNRVVKIYSAS
jgi:N4-gp56 family major capsid protein